MRTVLPGNDGRCGILHSPPAGSDAGAELAIVMEVKRLRYEADLMEVLPLAAQRLAARRQSDGATS